MIKNDSYNILGEFILEDYSANFHKLYFELKDLLYNLFPDGNIKFQPKDKIFFYQDDVDFYVSNTFPGFGIYNLQLVLKHLEIPNFFCVVFSNTPNIQKYLNICNDILTPTDRPLLGVNSYQDICKYLKNAFVRYQPIDITSPFVVMSRQQRFHRSYFFSQLFEMNLQNSGLIAYHNLALRNETALVKDNTNLSPCIFLTTDPFTLNNAELSIRKKVNQQTYIKFISKVNKFVNFNEDIESSNKFSLMQFQNSMPISSSFIYVGLETTVTHPEPYLSNISFKSIILKRPFIILGVPGTLKHLQSLGFKTFSTFWDESYDNILDFEDRVASILNVLKDFSEKNLVEINNIAKKMQDILDYNYNHIQDFVQSESLKLKLLKQ